MLTIPMYTMLYTTHIPWCYCWLYPCTQCYAQHTFHGAIVDYTHVHNVVHNTHSMVLLLTIPMYTMLCTTHIPWCYCWLYPCTQCCAQHTFHGAIVDYTHVHNVVHNTHSMVLLLTIPMYTMLYTTHIPWCYCWLYPCTQCRTQHTFHGAIVDYTHVHNVVHNTRSMLGSATASFKDLVRVAQENSTSQASFGLGNRFQGAGSPQTGSLL